MNFENRNMPKQINDLVIKDAGVAAIIADYAAGNRDKHLLMHGPAGSGKSIAAQLIVKARLGQIADTNAALTINGGDFSAANLSSIKNAWDMQRMLGAAHGYVIIDEVDFLHQRHFKMLRSLTSNTTVGTIIATTNGLHELDGPLKSRFLSVLVEVPTLSDWTRRTQQILANEGYNFSTQEVITLLNGFSGTGRDMVNWLEDYVLKFERNAPLVTLPAPTASTVMKSLQTTGKLLRRK